jgi:HK97 family phage prohead protease
MTFDASIRSELPRERRDFELENVEVRYTENGDTASLAGYAAMFGQPYTVRDQLGEYDETFVAGAFTRSLATGSTVYLLAEHGGLPLAGTGTGSLRVSEDQIGLRVEADLNMRSSYSMDVAVSMEHAGLSKMSHAFRAVKQQWNADYTTRTILEAQLFEVSVVTFPANPATSVAMRAEDFVGLSDDELRDYMNRVTAEYAARNAAPVVPGVPAALLRRRLELAARK